MDTVTREGLAVWLGPAVADLTDDQIDTLTDAYRRYQTSALVTARTGERGDYDDEDEAVLSAMVQSVLGELDLPGIASAAVAARAEQYAAVTALAWLGVPESRVARDGRVDRMTVRRILGKR